MGWYPQRATESALIAVTDAATTALTGNLDCADAQYAEIVVCLSAEANTDSTNVAIQLSESDDTVVTNFATWDADLNTTVDNTAAACAVRHVDLRGRKRYIRLTVTPDTTTNGAVGIAAAGLVYKHVNTGALTDQGDVVASAP
jgi:hypothetical protein